MVNNTTPGRWFRRIIWVGIAADVAFALPTIAAPTAMIAMAGLPTAGSDLWPRFASLLIVMISVFSMPAGLDIDRYRATAWFAVAWRLAAVVFFAFEPAYRLLMLVDGLFFVPLAILLTQAVRSERAPAAPPTVAAL